LQSNPRQLLLKQRRWRRSLTGMDGKLAEVEGAERKHELPNPRQGRLRERRIPH
jgi:hypothetical protein